MKENVIEIIRGQKVEIIELSVACSNDQINLFLSICVNGTIFDIHFYNVSRLNIQDLSTPMEIHGFEIICNKQKGWEKDSNYTIRDFEDGRINFVCEDFETQADVFLQNGTM